ncbi:MAG: aminoacyl-tRNA hydrolase [Cyclobacteriaceae bacterium]|nr:aminoacyl-tRNA hydrolase [Cyclobacteriaceae bacterium]
MKFLIAGLGNIGPEYELTRHNIGFLALDFLADHKKVEFRTSRLAFTADFKHKGRTVHLVKPTTYMNLSGRAVRYWLDHLKIPVENLMVLVDDIALPFGRIRIRSKGSSAGHNGLTDIEGVLGTNAYPRLRIGIGDEFSRGKQVEYVLSRFNNKEMEELPFIFNHTTEAVLSFISTGLERTMNFYNKKG